MVFYWICFRSVPLSQRVRGTSMLDVAHLAPWNMVGGGWGGRGGASPLRLPFARGPGVQCPVSSTRYSHSTFQNGLKMAQNDPFAPSRKSLGPLLEEIISDRFSAHVGLHHGLKTREKLGQGWPNRLKTGRNQPKMAQKGRFDHPQVSGTTFENFHFRPLLGPSGLVVGWQLMAVAVVGCLLAVDGGWRLLAVGSCRVGKGGTPLCTQSGG